MAFILSRYVLILPHVCRFNEFVIPVGYLDKNLSRPSKSTCQATMELMWKY